MLLITHPYEGETKELLRDRELYGKFLTAHIMNYFPNEVVLNFPLNFTLMRTEMGIKTTDADIVKNSIEWIGRADAVIFIDLPGRELCERSTMEKKAAKRLDVPVAILPFHRHRFDQQYKQNALLTEQKRVLNLLRSTLQES